VYGSITRRRAGDKGGICRTEMSDTQLTTIARLDERLQTLKERL
jgi:hypothetical protein